MNIFNEVRRLDLRTVAEHYGLDVRRGGMVHCLFHDDRTPSMKLYPDHFYCFGCGEHGDITAFTARLFDLRPLDAAKKLCADFGVTEGTSKPSGTVQPAVRSQRERENRAFRILTNYCQQLMEQRERYAPKSPDEPLHPLFTESLSELDKYQYYAEIFISGSRDERQKFMTERKDLLDELERKYTR